MFIDCCHSHVSHRCHNRPTDHRDFGRWSLTKIILALIFCRGIPFPTWISFPFWRESSTFKNNMQPSCWRRDGHDGNSPPLLAFHHSTVQNAPVASSIVGPQENQMRFGLSTRSRIHGSFRSPGARVHRQNGNSVCQDAVTSTKSLNSPIWGIYLKYNRHVNLQPVPNGINEACSDLMVDPNRCVYNIVQ